MLSYKMIGRNMKAARDRMDLSQEDVAAKLGMSVKYYGKLERGEVRQNLDRLAQVSSFLSVPLETLFVGSMPYQEYKNQPPQDETAAKVTQIVNGCDSAHKAAILMVCEAIALLDKNS